MRNLVLGLLVLVVGAVALLFWWLADANRLKPQIEALLTEHTGYPVAIGGDLSWSLLPPVTLTARSITTDLDGDRLEIGAFALDVELMSLLRERRAPENWEIRSVTLEDTTLASDADTIRLERLDLSGLRLDAPVPFSARVRYESPGEPPLPLTAQGNATLHADQSVQLDDLEFDMPDAAGRCTVNGVPSTGTWPAMRETAEDLIPVSALRDWNADVDCLVTRLLVDGNPVSGVTVKATVKDAVARVAIAVPEVFGGSADIGVNIDARKERLAWRLEPVLEGVDSRQLMTWLEQPVAWDAPLSWRGAFDLTGNTQAELAQSIRGTSHFDGTTGTLDITKLKAAALAIGKVTGEADKVERWPNPLRYRRLIGDWRVDGERHVFDVALDNLTLRAEGTYDVDADAADLLAHFTFTSDPAYQTFTVADLLVDLPVPMRCSGSIETIECAADEAATREMLANALGNSQFRSKLDKTIDEQVPEEYRDAARSLLDLLGNKPKQD